MAATTDPLHCAGGLVTARGKVLLGLRTSLNDTYPGVWDLFGGHVENGETVEQTLLRELGEELDIVPTAYTFLTTLAEPVPSRNGRRLYHIYKVTAWSGSGPRLCGGEHAEIRWYAPTQALSLALALPEYGDLLRKVALGRT